jgi:hypothetical protein
MKLPGRTVAYIGAVCVTVGWLLASTLTPPVANVQSLPGRQPKPTPVGEEPTLTERLQFRTERTTVAPTPKRNPFVFGERSRTAATQPTADDVGAQEPSLPATSQPVVGPVFSLAGIGITGETRTAILTDGQAVHILKVGDRIAGYEVVELTNNSVTLGEQSGLRYVLRLR